MSAEEHKLLVSQIIKYLGSQRNFRVWKNHTGATKVGDRFIHYGLKGSADITGIIQPAGVRLEIEVKTGVARQSKEQRNFEAMIERFGGIYIVARDLEGVYNELNRRSIMVQEPPK